MLLRTITSKGSNPRAVGRNGGNGMRDIRRGLWLMAIGITIFAAVQCLADEPSDVRGCYARYNRMTGKFSFEPFLKVDVPPTDGEDGEMQVWGFRVWNLEPPDKNGKTHPVNIPETLFIPLNTYQEVPAGTRRKSIRCPDGIW